MLRNTVNCVGLISEIWEIKPPLCTSLDPLKKKKSPSLGSITATHKLSELKRKLQKNFKNLFKDKAALLLLLFLVE